MAERQVALVGEEENLYEAARAEMVEESTPLLEQEPGDEEARVVTAQHRTAHYVLVGALACVFLVTVSGIPILNKYLFSCLANHQPATIQQCSHLYRGMDKQAFNYPLTVTFLQLTFCWVLLTAYNILSHMLHRPEGQDQNKQTQRTWMLDKNFLYKARFIFPPGVLFGIKYGITNFGLSVVPANVHLLLQSTSLLWTVVLAYLVTSERPGMVQLLCCGLTVVGTVLVSYDFQQTTQAEAYKLIVNLVTPFVEGITVVFLRRATKQLIIDDPHRLGITAPELTAIKLLISSATILPFALFKEGFPEAFKTVFGQSSKGVDVPFWSALAMTDTLNVVLIFACACLTLIFQTNITCLASVAGAVSVGLLGDVKVVPQTLLANAVFHTWMSGAMHWVGAVVVMLSGAFYSASKIWSHRNMVGSRTTDRTLFISARRLMVN